VANIPAHRLRVETDAPYLLPRNAPRQRDRRNEPGLLPYVAQAVAAARGVGVDRLAAATSANARAFFALPSGA
jgi:TatD DNase family protein